MINRDQLSSTRVSSAYKKTSFVLPVLMGLFFSPLFLAAWFYLNPHYLPKKNAAHGTLLQPPLQLASLQTSALWPNHWGIVYLAPRSCTFICQNKIKQRQSILSSVGIRPTSVTYGVITASASKIKNLFIIPVSPYRLHQLLSYKGSTRFYEGTFFVIDPRGNILLAYGPSSPPSDMYQDLKILRRNFNID